MKKTLAFLALVSLTVNGFAKSIPFELSAATDYSYCYFNELSTSEVIKVTLNTPVNTFSIAQVVVTGPGLIHWTVIPPTAFYQNLRAKSLLCLNFDAKVYGYAGVISGVVQEDPEY